jgi:hypothetical protein
MNFLNSSIAIMRFSIGASSHVFHDGTRPGIIQVQRMDLTAGLAMLSWPNAA